MSERFIKIGFAVLALFAVVFGFMRLGQNIKLTFSSGENGEPQTNDAILEETKLKVIDTDEDGLNDWDELNVYGTSPYLADSDSDNLKDMDEIKKGTDPNCPAGKVCGTSLQPDKPATPAGTEGSTGEEGAGAATSLPTEELKNFSGDDIKELLKQGGITAEQLEGVSDDELKQLLEEVLNQQ